MQRKKPLRRSAIPRSRKPIKARKADKSKRRWAGRRDKGYCDWIRSKPCLLRDHTLGFGRTGIIACSGRVECAHVKPRSLGGDDVANTVPLCTAHHRQSHSRGVQTFQHLYSINLETKALYYGGMQPPKYERDNTWLPGMPLFHGNIT
jgi:hypothetical protein